MIASESRIFFDGLRIQTATLEIGLGSYHEESRVLTDEIEPFEIHVSSIHNVEGPGFRDQAIEDIDVVKIAVADMDERRDAAAQIQECVKFDSGFGLYELRPRKNRQAKIDGGGIECIDCLGEFDPKVVVGIECSCVVDKVVGELCIDAPVPYFVCIGQGISGNVASYTDVIQLVSLSTKACLYISKTFPICQLRKSHTAVLIETTEVVNFVMTSVTLNASSKSVNGKVVYYLRKN